MSTNAHIQLIPEQKTLIAWHWLWCGLDVRITKFDLTKNSQMLKHALFISAV